MKKKLLCGIVLGAAVALLRIGPAAAAGNGSLIFDNEGKMYRVFPVRELGAPSNESSSAGARFTRNLYFHNGPVLLRAAEKSLWWGAAFASDVQPHVSAFFGQFGTAAEYQVITQYYDSAHTNIQTVNLGGFDTFDTTTPPSTVNDARCQQEIQQNFANGNLGSPDPNTVYFLFLPAGVTSTLGSSSSCVNYCGYHSNFTYNGVSVKYAVMPYPNCGGCQGSGQAGLSIEAASETIVAGHEMREAATDALGTAWFDLIGQEADDKCAWQLFIDGAYQYQKEWSNAVTGCVMKGVSGP